MKIILNFMQKLNLKQKIISKLNRSSCPIRINIKLLNILQMILKIIKLYRNIPSMRMFV